MATSVINSSINATIMTQVKDLHPQDLFFSFMCLAGMISNFLIILTIALENSLHNKSQFVLISLSVGEIFFLLSYCVSGLYKFITANLDIPDSSYQLACMLKEFPILTSASVLKNLMTALAVDRFLCMKAPVFYRQVSVPKYIVTLNVICWTHGLTVNLFAFVKYDPNHYVLSCSMAVAMDRMYLIIFGMLDNVITVITLLMYATLAAMFWRRYRNQKGFNMSERQEWRRQIDFEVFVAMVIVGAVYSINMLTSFAMSIGYSLVSAEVAGVITGLSLTVVLLGSNTHFLVYYKVNRLFRSGFLRVVLRKHSNEVTPIRSTSMGPSSTSKVKDASMVVVAHS